MFDIVKFSDRLPEERQDFVFIHADDPYKWYVGWRDWYHIREEGGPSFRHDDSKLIYWYPLPKVPEHD